MMPVTHRTLSASAATRYATQQRAGALADRALRELRYPHNADRSSSSASNGASLTLADPR